MAPSRGHHLFLLSSWRMRPFILLLQAALSCVTCFPRIPGFCKQLFFTRLGDGPLLNLHCGGSSFFSGFPSPRFEVRVFHSPRRVAYQDYESCQPSSLIGFRAPTACPRTTRISDKQPHDVNASSGDLTNRGRGETQAFWGHFIETRSSSLIPPSAIFNSPWGPSRGQGGQKFKESVKMST